ncbi:hypothetical protein K458DRAFT_416743 [Lentithecium fluviatile CBS 122367]|uniref:Uncharacterized protein n=1 Tax=Lentithecium fluviatile CBS 122367 TaxID=1168545 RepID=A0A6G1J5M4_9PLEO|nr:hypothetical protein K458DRAFT_416743 [Lentithecium fluviatile CBS 122367]
MATQTTAPSSPPAPSPSGLRSAFRRWKDKWRTQPPSRTSNTNPSKAAYTPVDSAPTSRPTTTKSTKSTTASTPTPPPSTHPPATQHPRLRSVPSSPVPLHTALFTPTTQTTIHSPADPRNRSASPSPANTLRKHQRPPLSRRNTIQAESLASTSYPHAQFEDFSNLPLGIVTTTIVAGNGGEGRRKRHSRLRLSFSSKRSVSAGAGSVPSPLGSPGLMSRWHERSGSRAAGRFEQVPEVEGGETGPAMGMRARADSYREGLVEEMRGGKKDRVNAGGIMSGRGTPVPGAAG